MACMGRPAAICTLSRCECALALFGSRPVYVGSIPMTPWKVLIWPWMMLNRCHASVSPTTVWQTHLSSQAGEGCRALRIAHQ